MSEEQFAATESAAPPSEAQEAIPVAADTTETVAETDEQKNQRIAEEANQRHEKRLNGFQRRINEVVGEKHALSRQVEMLTQALANAIGRGQVPQQQSEQGPPQRRADESYEDFVERKATWAAEQKATRLVQERLEQAQRQQAQAQLRDQAVGVRAQFEARMQQFAKDAPDWDQVVGSNDDVVIPDEAAGLLHVDPDGPAILYAIGKNPALAAQLHGKPLAMQAMVLGQIKATLKAAPQVSKAPTPGKPVGSRGGSVNDGPSDDDDINTWLKKRNAQVRK